MSEANKQGSIFQEMIERRSRSEELNSLAISKGLECVLPIDASDESELPTKSAFDFAEVDQTDVPVGGIQGADSVSIYEEIADVPSESGQGLGFADVAEDEAAAISESAEPASPGYFDSIDEVSAPVALDAQLSGPSSEDIVSGNEEANPSSDVWDEFDSADETASEEDGDCVNEPAAAESQASDFEEPVSVEEDIWESEELLPPEPEAAIDAEVMLAAEELVNRIGPVVDIQSLPKTQPMRVLSKSAKAAEDANPPASPASVELPKEKPLVAKEDSSAVKAEVVEETTKPKPKKKKVSLLDSYFKGL